MIVILYAQQFTSVTTLEVCYNMAAEWRHGLLFNHQERGVTEEDKLRPQATVYNTIWAGRIPG